MNEALVRRVLAYLLQLVTTAVSTLFDAWRCFMSAVFVVILGTLVTAPPEAITFADFLNAIQGLQFWRLVFVLWMIAFAATSLFFRPILAARPPVLIAGVRDGNAKP